MELSAMSTVRILVSEMTHQRIALKIKDNLKRRPS